MLTQTMTSSATRISVRPTGMALGADIVGADIASMSDADLEVVRQALAEHLVVRFRGAGPSDRDFQAFAARLGPLRGSPDYTRSRRVYMADAPLVTVISNMVEEGQAVGEHGDGELNWHTDLGFEDEPAGFTFLLAREVPASGGDTHFANMYRACDGLPAELRTTVERLRCKHQASHNAQGGKRPGYVDIETDDPREMPGPIHPILRTHPATGRKALSGAALRRLCSRAAAGAQRGAARPPLGPGGPAPEHLGAAMAGRGPHRLGQSLHHASSRFVPRSGQPSDAPPRDPRRTTDLTWPPPRIVRPPPRRSAYGQAWSTASTSRFCV